MNKINVGLYQKVEILSLTVVNINKCIKDFCDIILISYLKFSSITA